MMLIMIIWVLNYNITVLNILHKAGSNYNTESAIGN